MPKKKDSKEPAPEDPKRPVTLRDIAKELDISHVTVSLALRDHPRISEATRTRVKQKAEAMGYHPDPMLSALSHYRLTSREKPVQATLAWINPLTLPEKLRQFDEFNHYWNGAEAAAKKLGFHLEEFRTKELSLKRMDAIFKTRSIRGLLLAPLAWETTPVDWDEFPWQDYAAVCFGPSQQGPALHYVTSAQASDAILAFEKILARGYRRIGLIADSSPRRMFSAGYLRAQQVLPKSQRLSLLTYDWDYSHEESSLDLKELSTWMDKEKPDAIITAYVHLPAMLQELGYSIPDDVGLAATSILDAPIDSGIDQNPEEIGRAAVRTLDSLLNEHHFGIPEVRNRILVEGRWVNGSMLPDRN